MDHIECPYQNDTLTIATLAGRKTLKNTDVGKWLFYASVVERLLCPVVNMPGNVVGGGREYTE